MTLNQWFPLALSFACRSTPSGTDMLLPNGPAVHRPARCSRWFGTRNVAQIIEYTDRHSMQIPCTNSGAIRMLVHSLVNSIHNEALRCYTDQHNSVIAAKDSTLDPVHRWAQYTLAVSIQDM